jgi:predicted MPP superfamily phosphohydrolase
MKIVALGDTHGRPYWKTVVETSDFDKVVFVGDYFDSRDFILEKQQIKNFREILAFKKSNPAKVVLLIGNHDFHYLPGIEDRYSLYQSSYAAEIGKILADAKNKNLLQMCYVYQRFLFTHAGVTKTWANANGIDIEHIEDSINALFRNKPDAFKFTPGTNDSPRGEDITQTPIWVRQGSLQFDKVDGYTQVVGHTPQDILLLSTDVILIDTLGSTGQYLTIVDQTPIVSGKGGQYRYAVNW